MRLALAGGVRPAILIAHAALAAHRKCFSPVAFAYGRGIRIYGDCQSAKTNTDQQEWMARAVLELPHKATIGARWLNQSNGKLSERRFYNRSEPLALAEPLPFGWSHYSMNDEGDTGCLMVHLPPQSLPAPSMSTSFWPFARKAESRLNPPQPPACGIFSRP